MRKLSVNEYAREIKKSPSNIYQRIKKGEIETEEINGKTFIIIDDEEKNEDNIEVKYLKKEIKLLQLLVKSKDAEIDTLRITLNNFSMFLNNRLPEKVEIQEAEIDDISSKNGEVVENKRSLFNKIISALK